MASTDYQDIEDETTYGDDNKAFFMAQNKDSKAPVHVGAATSVERGKSTRTNPCQCWLVGLRKETWINWFYNVFLNMIFGSFCWPFFTALTILGCTLLPFCLLGVPVLLGTLQLARFMAVADINLLNLTVPRSQRVYRVLDDNLRADQTLMGWARAVGCSCQSYGDFFFLWLCKMPIAWFGFFVTIILSIISVSLVAAPIVWGSCDTCFKNGNMCLGTGSDWTDGTCDGWKIDSLGDTFALFFIGLIACVITLHISNGVAYLSKELSKCALASDRSSGSSEVRAPLLNSGRPATETTSANIGSLVGTKETAISVREEKDSQRKD